MRITNRTSHPICIWGYKSDDAMRAFALNHFNGPMKVAAGASVDYGWGQHAVRLDVFDTPDYWAAGNIVEPGAGRAVVHGTLLNTRTVLIVNPDGVWSMVCWEDAVSRWRSLEASAQVPEAENGAGQVGLDFGRAATEVIMGSLATIVVAAEATVPGALIASGVLAVGMLVLTAVDSQQDAAPPPPDLAQIEQVVRKVVEEELKISKASDLAHSMHVRAEWIIEQARRLQNQLTGTGPTQSAGKVPPEDAERFAEEIENVTSVTSDFIADIKRLRDNPALTRYVIPSYKVGIAAHLFFLRAELAIRYARGARPTVEDAQDFQKVIADHVLALHNARDFLETFIASKVADARLQGTPEGEEIARLIRLAYARTSKPEDVIQDFVSSLWRVNDFVTIDQNYMEKGGAPAYLWSADLERLRLQAAGPTG